MKHKRGLLISVMSCLCALSLTAACGKGGDSSSSGRTETAEGVETGRLLLRRGRRGIPDFA